jgi:hypothetical protein
MKLMLKAPLLYCIYRESLRRCVAFLVNDFCFDFVFQALVAEEFLERSASQLTYHGLCELNTAMGHDELAVLFRNNHFSTIFKKKVSIFFMI